MAGTGEVIGRESGEGVWAQGPASMFATGLRLVDEEVSLSEDGLGTGLQGMACSSVSRTDFCCDGGSDRGNVSDRKSEEVKGMGDWRGS